MDGAIANISPTPDVDLDILGLASDSRDVRPGFLFAALSGRRADGRRFIAEAVARGAVALLIADEADAAGLPAPGPRLLVYPNPRRRLALMAARFYAPQPAVAVAVTGTNGKTSTAEFSRQIWHAAGKAAASLGTIGIIGPDFAHLGGLTTPDPITLHRELNTLARAGIDHVALEASSHGLDQYRLDGVALTAAAFTNLTRDHLDYHADLAAYFAAKARLFTELLPPQGTAVLNFDTAEGKELAARCRARGQRVIGVGQAADADIRLVAARPEELGQALDLVLFGARHETVLPLMGGFQIANALTALGLAVAAGTPLATGFSALANLKGVPGRLERVAVHPSGAAVIVDYAHTPDALETVLTALRPHCAGRLVAVFGCGGDRDAGKRPQMGAIAERLADVVIITDDNPRSEDAAAIRRAILAQCPKAREIRDRAAAIAAALALLRPGDLLLVAGKGHESGQIIGGRVLPFNDAEVIRAALRAEAGA